MEKSFLIILIVGIITLVLFLVYKTILKSKNTIIESLSIIEENLKNRHKLTQNILVFAKKVMSQEKEILDKITELKAMAMRAPSGSPEKFKAESMFETQLKKLIQIIEKHPDLKSNEITIQEIKSYRILEEKISQTRKIYNTTLTKLKKSIKIFPLSLFSFLAYKVINLGCFEENEATITPVDASKLI